MTIPRWQYISCPVCHRPLAHIPGATLLLCPACNHILNPSLLPPLTTAAQTACANCRHIMLHPLGSRVVVCPVCTAHTAAPLSYYICPGCRLYLVYSTSLPAVVCAVCHTVDPPVDRVIPRTQALLPLKQGAPPRPMPKLPPRRIPWLPSTPVQPLAPTDAQQQRVRRGPPGQGVGRRSRTGASSGLEEGDLQAQEVPGEEVNGQEDESPILPRNTALSPPRSEPSSAGQRHSEEEEPP